MRKIIVATVVLAVCSSGLPAYAKGEKGPRLKSTIKSELELKQKGPNVEIKVKTKGLTPGVEFAVRAYVPAAPGLDPSSDCGAAPAVRFLTTSDEKGKLKIEEEILDRDLEEIGSVSIRRGQAVVVASGCPGLCDGTGTGLPRIVNEPVICWQDLLFIPFDDEDSDDDD